MHLSDRFLKEIWCESFAKTGKAWLRITTGSMGPIIKPGEMILVENVPTNLINTGDIVVFEVDDVFFAHRVIKKRVSHGRTFFLQKGDKSGGAMEIPEDWVIGRVVAIEKIDGFLIRLDEGLGRHISYVFYRVSRLEFSLYKRLRYKNLLITKILYLERFYSLFKNLLSILYQVIAILLCKCDMVDTKTGARGNRMNAERAQ